MHIHVHYHPDEETAERLVRIEDMLGQLLENQEKIMSDVVDLKPALDAIDAKVAVIKTDVETLLAKLASIPTGGLTPDQQAAINDAVDHANKIAVSLGAIDAEVNPAPST